MQTTGVYLMPAYVWRHGCVHDLCMYRLLSVHTRVSHSPRLLRVYPLGRVCNLVGIRPGGVYMRSVCVPAHACVYPTRVCPHKPAVPVPRAPVGFTPEHRTHGRGVRRRPPPPRPLPSRGDPPDQASLPRRPPCGEGGNHRGPAITPRVFVEGGAALPSLRERQAKQPATGRGARKKHPGGESTLRGWGGHFPGTFSHPKSPHGFDETWGAGEAPEQPRVPVWVRAPADPAAAALQLGETCWGVNPI